MNINPELQRNFWLELSPNRLLVTFAIVCGLLYLGWLFDDKQAAGVAQVAYWVFAVMCVILGPRQASESLTQELANHTWDGQRMSGLGPWSMVWGKLFGGTAFSWSMGLFALLVYLLAEPERDVAFANAWVMVLSALAAQSLALMLTLIIVAKGERSGGRMVGLSQLVGVIVGLVLLSTLVSDNESGNSVPALMWWGHFLTRHTMVLWSTLVFFAWSLVANYRLMGQELQVRQGPLAWLVFHAFLIVWLLGFLESGGREGQGIVLAFLVSITLALLAVFIDPKNRLSMRTGIHAIGQGDVLRIWKNTPGWLVSALLAIVFSLLTMQLPQDQGVKAPMMVVDSFLGTNLGSNTFAPAVMLFVLRDLSLVLLANLQAPAGSPGAQRADLTAIIWLAVLYWLLPALITLSGNTGLLVLFVPANAQGLADGWVLLPPFLEWVLVLWLLVRAWRRNWAQSR